MARGLKAEWVGSPNVWVQINRTNHDVFTSSKWSGWTQVSDKHARALRAACAVLEPHPISDAYDNMYVLTPDEFNAIVGGV